MPEYDEIVEGPLARETQAAAAAGTAAPSAAAEGPALLSWGDLTAEAGGSLERLRRAAEYRRPAVERVGLRPLRQWLGPGADTVTLEGTMHPAVSGGTAAVDALRAAAAAGEARPLLDGRGTVLGRWAALRFEATWAVLHSDGRPRRIEYTLELARVGDDAPSGELRGLAADAAANGDVAAVVDAVAAADTPAAALAAAQEAAGAAADEAPERSLARRVLDAVRTAVAAPSSMADVRRAALRAASRLPGAPRLDRPLASVAYRAAAGDVLPAAALVALPADTAPAGAARRVVQLWT